MVNRDDCTRRFYLLVLGNVHFVTCHAKVYAHVRFTTGRARDRLIH
jgi:hypothetical protein